MAISEENEHKMERDNPSPSSIHEERIKKIFDDGNEVGMACVNNGNDEETGSPL